MPRTIRVEYPGAIYHDRLSQVGNWNYNLRFDPLTDSGLTVQCRRRAGEPLEVSLTWQEIADLVSRLRTSGKVHEFKGITYYADH